MPRVSPCLLGTLPVQRGGPECLGQRRRTPHIQPGCRGRKRCTRPSSVNGTAEAIPMGFVCVHLRISAFAGAALAATFAQTRTAARPKFEVASIKPCKPGMDNGRRSGWASLSPGQGAGRVVSDGAYTAAVEELKTHSGQSDRRRGIFVILGLAPPSAASRRPASRAIFSSTGVSSRAAGGSLGSTDFIRSNV